MTFRETAAARWQTAKPVLKGLVVGLIAGPLISNFAGWQQTTGSATAQARAGVVEQRALICEERARADVKEPNKLDWSARNQLAAKWSVMAGAASAESDVTSSCAGKLART